MPLGPADGDGGCGMRLPLVLCGLLALALAAGSRAQIGPAPAPVYAPSADGTYAIPAGATVVLVTCNGTVMAPGVNYTVGAGSVTPLQGLGWCGDVLSASVLSAAWAKSPIVQIWTSAAVPATATGAVSLSAPVVAAIVAAVGAIKSACDAILGVLR